MCSHTESCTAHWWFPAFEPYWSAGFTKILKYWALVWKTRCVYTPIIEILNHSIKQYFHEYCLSYTKRSCSCDSYIFSKIQTFKFYHREQIVADLFREVAQSFSRKCLPNIPSWTTTVCQLFLSNKDGLFWKEHLVQLSIPSPMCSSERQPSTLACCTDTQTNSPQEIPQPGNVFTAKIPNAIASASSSRALVSAASKSEAKRS